MKINNVENSAVQTIQYDELLRYLGQRSTPDASFKKQIENVCQQLLQIANAKYIYRYFDLTPKTPVVQLEGVNLILKGKDIATHLNGCFGCVIMAVTIGAEVDRQIRLLQITDMVKAMILDAAATTLIEQICDVAETEIHRTYGENIYFTDRYSPGYGDLPLALQPEILHILDSYKKIGLSVTSSNLLVPKKSVTAIIGLAKQPIKIRTKRGCDNCNQKEKCLFRRDGATCAKQ